MNNSGYLITGPRHMAEPSIWKPRCIGEPVTRERKEGRSRFDASPHLLQQLEQMLRRSLESIHANRSGDWD